MYYVVNLSENAIVGECHSYSLAELILVSAVDESDGLYTFEDFTILTEEDL